MLELFFVILVQMNATLGVVPTALILIAATALTFFLANLAAHWLAEQFFPSGNNWGGGGSNPEVQRRSRRDRLRVLSDEEIGAWLAGHPSDDLAIAEKCRRLREQSEWSACATQMERLLPLVSKRPACEVSLMHHQLADLYAGPLERPDRAREILNGFVMRFPKSDEAALMRERMNNLAETFALDEAAVEKTR